MLQISYPSVNPRQSRCCRIWSGHLCVTIEAVADAGLAAQGAQAVWQVRAPRAGFSVSAFRPKVAVEMQGLP